MTLLDVPSGCSVTEDEDVPLSDDCYCGENDPVASVSWMNRETEWPDSLDACPLCLDKAVGVAWETADERHGVNVEVLPDDQLVERGAA